MFSNKKNFEVKITGRAGLIYKEKDKELEVDSEMLIGDVFDMVIYMDSIDKWMPPNDDAILSDIDKQRIRRNIEEELSNIRIEWK